MNKSTIEPIEVILIVRNSPFFTTWYEKLGDPFFRGVNSVFLAPELRILCRAKPTCVVRAKRGEARAKRGIKFVSEGAKNTEFTPRWNGSSSESYQVVKIELFSLP